VKKRWLTEKLKRSSDTNDRDYCRGVYGNIYVATTYKNNQRKKGGRRVFEDAAYLNDRSWFMDLLWRFEKRCANNCDQLFLTFVECDYAILPV
jgi:hypothetical protein